MTDKERESLAEAWQQLADAWGTLVAEVVCAVSDLVEWARGR